MAKKPVKKVLFTSHTANFHKFNRPFMRMLKEQGYVVHYASAGEEKVYDTDKHFDVPFERSPFKLGNIKAYFKLKKIIDREKYDLIHTHTPMGSVVTRLAARAARKKGTRVIYTAHGFHFFKGAPLLNWIVYYPIEKFMARYTDTLITINDEDYERAKAKFNTNVEYVPGVGVDLKNFSPLSKEDKAKYRKKLGLDNQDLVIIYVAELNKNKNQTFLLDLTSRLNEAGVHVRLILCGNGPLGQYYTDISKYLKINDKVLLLGYRNDIRFILSAADVCVASSRREGLGLNLIEAASVGLPIIASDNRGHRSVISGQINNWNYLFNEHKDMDKLVKILQKMNSKIEFYRKGRPSNSLNLEKYDVGRVTELMRDLYRI